MKRRPFVCSAMSLLALLAWGCQGSALEVAERDLAAMERQLAEKTISRTRIEKDIESGKYPNLTESLQKQKAQYDQELETLTSDIDQQKRKIAELKQQDQ